MKNLLHITLIFVLSSLAKAKEKPNIIVILSDDHRYDFMGFHSESPEWLETPNMDFLASKGAHIKNAFVSTSLCSPSRASILTGMYMHHHKVVDNQRPVPKGTTFFPQHLQKEGYHTAFIGKWHMGHEDDHPRPGFDHWVSFKGQGEYFDPALNVNGQRKKNTGYITDILTDHAIKWYNELKPKDKPFMLYLSYKAVHYPFTPAPRHQGKYQGQPIPYPETMARTEENYYSQSKWIKERRYGIHGIDHMETGALDKDPVPSFDNLYWRFCETVHGLDENIGKLIKTTSPSAKNTFLFYLGDNGFALGEHGFYDKRDAFEESIRIPMLAYAPGRIDEGLVINDMIQNIDIAPTIMNIAGLKNKLLKPKMDGISFAPLLDGQTIKNPRKHILYEYHWEWNFPATPTCLAIRTDRYKYIYYHGVWDRNGFYDLMTDPHERHNLIQLPQYRDKIANFRKTLFKDLRSSGGLNIPIRTPKGEQFYDRKIK
jgi:N-acetylglucosamine-6-sulfatase